jgi:hypothetical protein
VKKRSGVTDVAASRVKPATRKARPCNYPDCKRARVPGTDRCAFHNRDVHPAGPVDQGDDDCPVLGDGFSVASSLQTIAAELRELRRFFEECVIFRDAMLAAGRDRDMRELARMAPEISALGGAVRALEVTMGAAVRALEKEPET